MTYPMHRMYRMLRMHRTPLPVAAVVLTLATNVIAADKTPVSALPVLRSVPDATDGPGASVIPGITIKEGEGKPSYFDVVASVGYCLVARDGGIHFYHSSTNTADPEVWRIVENDGAASLERIRFGVLIGDRKPWLKSRVSIALREVARAEGVTVWGFREANGDVVLLARDADSGRESPRPAKKGEPIDSRFVSSDCTFGATVLDGTAALRGTSATLAGKLPAVGEGKRKTFPRFFVDASLSSFHHDGEPTLAVRIRRAD